MVDTIHPSWSGFAITWVPPPLRKTEQGRRQPGQIEPHGLGRGAGYPSLEKVGVFRAGNRPCLIMDAAASFNLEVQSAADPGNSEVRAWQRLTLRFQGASPRVTPGRKWVPMRRMLSLAHRNAAAAEAAVHRNPSVVRASQAGLARTEARTLGRGRAELLAFREATPSIARAADRHRARRLK
jgi:hypothetical protein